MNTGVYQILNTVNGKSYVGSTADSFGSRWSKHRHQLRLNKHHSIVLQRAYNKYSEKSFKYTILQYSLPKDCIRKEQWFIDVIKPEYNISQIAGSLLGVIPTKQTRDKISKSLTGFKQSRESIDKSAKSRTGLKRPNWKKFSPEIEQKRIASLCRFLYKISTPDGTIVETNNLNLFVKEKKLNHGKLIYTLRGIDPRGYKATSCKGYKLLSQTLIKK